MAPAQTAAPSLWRSRRRRLHILSQHHRRRKQRDSNFLPRRALKCTADLSKEARKNPSCRLEEQALPRRRAEDEHDWHPELSPKQKDRKQARMNVGDSNAEAAEEQDTIVRKHRKHKAMPSEELKFQPGRTEQVEGKGSTNQGPCHVNNIPVWVTDDVPQQSPYFGPRGSPRSGPGTSPRLAPQQKKVVTTTVLALALTVTVRKAVKTRAKLTAGKPPIEAPPSLHPKALDPQVEIDRILQFRDGSAAAIFGVTDLLDVKAVGKAWKRLVLLLHPDKLQVFDNDVRAAGAQALQEVHRAKEELRRHSQEHTADVPEDVVLIGRGRCIQTAPGARKYEIQWKIPEAQDPHRPVEKYEVWGPKYFTDKGDPLDWVLLASLPPLQSHFVIVEEAPTQQDVMWAADRINRPTLPIAVHAVNGRGSSEAATIELAWATAFPWLNGARSVMCQQCFQLSPCRGPYSKCSGCGQGIPQNDAVTVRCRDCFGEILWSQANTFSCTCCARVYGSLRPGKPSTNGTSHDNGGRWPKTHAPVRRW